MDWLAVWRTLSPEHNVDELDPVSDAARKQLVRGLDHGAPEAQPPVGGYLINRSRKRQARREQRAGHQVRMERLRTERRVIRSAGARTASDDWTHVALKWLRVLSGVVLLAVTLWLLLAHASLARAAARPTAILVGVCPRPDRLSLTFRPGAAGAAVGRRNSVRAGGQC